LPGFKIFMVSLQEFLNFAESSIGAAILVQARIGSPLTGSDLRQDTVVRYGINRDFFRRC
jgi:hypothetical protein